MIQKLRNKNGFTLVEVIAVVVIIGLLAGISIPLVTKYLGNGKEKYNQNVEKEFLTVVKDYFADNPEKIPNRRNSSVSVWLPELQAKNYLTEELKDADGGSCYDSVGYVNYEAGNLNYYACLKCDNYEGSTYGEYKDCKIKGGYDACLNFPNIEIKDQYLVEDIENEEDDIWLPYDGTLTKLNVKIILDFNQPVLLKYNGKSEKSVFVDDNHRIELVFSEDVKLEKGTSFQVVGECGNDEFSLGQDIFIDKNAPLIDIVGEKKYVIPYDDSDNKIEISNTLTVVDDGSGISKIMYKYSTDSEYTIVNEAIDKLTLNRTVSSGVHSLNVVAGDQLAYLPDGSIKDVEHQSSKNMNINVYNEVRLVSQGNVIETIEKAKGEKINLSGKVTREGYYLTEWKATNGSTYDSDGEYADDVSTILEAQWEEVTADKFVTINFYCGDSSTISKTGQYGVGNQFHQCDPKTGYTQNGWSLTYGGSKNWNTKATINQTWIDIYVEKTQPIKLYAVWTPKVATVVYDCDKDGAKDSGETKVTFTYGVSNQKFSATACSKTGYNLGGWHRNAMGDSAANDYDTTWTVNNNFKDTFGGKTVYLTPNWNAKTVTVHYDCDGDGTKDSNEKTQKFTYGKTTEKFNSTACSKTGYVLNKWHRNKVGTSPANDYGISWTVSNDFKNTFAGKTIKLTPVWKAKTVTVVYDCDKDNKKDSNEVSQKFTYGTSGQKLNKNACSGIGWTVYKWHRKKIGDNAANDYTASWTVSNTFKNTFYGTTVYLTPKPIYVRECSDQVAPECVLVTTCHSVTNGVSASFKCRDTNSSIKVYSIFAQDDWQEAEFANANAETIRKRFSYKGTANANTWFSYTPTFTTKQTPALKKGVQYNFYFAAFDSCGPVVYTHETTACKYNG